VLFFILSRLVFAILDKVLGIIDIGVFFADSA